MSDPLLVFCNEPGTQHALNNFQRTYHIPDGMFEQFVVLVMREGQRREKLIKIREEDEAFMDAIGLG